MIVNYDISQIQQNWLAEYPRPPTHKKKRKEKKRKLTLELLLYTLFLFQVPSNLRRMGSNGVDAIPSSDEAGGSEPTIEIKIKTLDSQTYTMRVDKQVISVVHSCYIVIESWP